MSDTTYIGTSDPKRCEYEVHACNGGTQLRLNPRFDLRNHSPDGFAWGYGGSGPAQLALALLADATGKDEIALKYYQRYKAEIVARLPVSFQLPISAVSRWVLRQQQEEAMSARPEGTYSHQVFRDHNCGGCNNGAKPCREGNYNSCSWPRARND